MQQELVVRGKKLPQNEIVKNDFLDYQSPRYPKGYEKHQKYVFPVISLERANQILSERARHLKNGEKFIWLIRSSNTGGMITISYCIRNKTWEKHHCRYGLTDQGWQYSSVIERQKIAKAEELVVLSDEEIIFKKLPDLLEELRTRNPDFEINTLIKPSTLKTLIKPSHLKMREVPTYNWDLLKYRQSSQQPGVGNFCEKSWLHSGEASVEDNNNRRISRP